MEDKRRFWTKEELDFLKNNYKTMFYKDIGKKLNKRSICIKDKVSRMGLRKQLMWSKEDVEFLKNNYLTMSYKDISKKLNKKVVWINDKVSRSRALGNKAFIKDKRYNHSLTPGEEKQS